MKTPFDKTVGELVALKMAGTIRKAGIRNSDDVCIYVSQIQYLLGAVENSLVMKDGPLRRNP